MTVDKVQNPLNNVVNGNTGSAPAQPVTTETSTPIFDESSKKKKLTEEDIKIMKSIGLNPDDPAAIEQWNAMDETEKNKIITKYYEQLQNNNGHITSDSPEQKTPPAPSGNAPQVTTNQDTPEAPTEVPVKTVTPGDETPVTASTAAAVSAVEEEVAAVPKKHPEGEEVVQADSDEAAQFEKTEPLALRERIGLEPIKLSEKPSLVSLAPSKSMEAILKETKVKMQDFVYENNVNLVKNFITKDMWKGMPEEERIKVLQSMLPPEFQNLSQEEKDKCFNEFLEHRVKQDRGISDERWNNFSDERKAKLRMKYALDFDIAIKKGFTEDEVDKISNYDRLIYGTKKLEESYNSLSEEQKVSKSGLAMKAKIEAGKHVGQTINDVSTLLTSIDENGQILQNIEVSKTRDYELKNKVKYSEISDEKIKRNLIKQDARFVAQTLRNSPSEKRIENLKNILLGSSSDTAYLADLLFQVTREMKLSKEEAAALHNDIHEASGLIAKENEALKARCETSEQSEKPEQKKLNEDLEHRNLVQLNLDNVIAINYTSDLSEYNAQELAKRTIKHNNDTAVNNMKESIGKDKTRSYSLAICEFLKHKKYSEGAIEKTTSHKSPEIKKEVAVGVVSLVNNGEIADEVIKSEVPALYKPEEGKEADPESQLEIQEMFHTGAPGNAAVIKAEQKAMRAGYIHKDAEVKFYQAGFEESKKLPEAEAVQSQKDWSDVIPSVHKDNQLALHEITMTSKYEEVLEYATNNISRYDESVQADAIKASINTGNKKVIDAAAKVANEITYEKNVSKSDNSNIANSHEVQKAIQDVEVKYQKDITSKVADTFAKNNLEPGNVSVEGLSESEKREYYTRQFENSTIQEQYRLLSRLPDSMKKDVYSKMAMYCPNMLKSIAGAYGADILKLSGVLPLNVICIVAKAMLSAGGSAKVDGAKFILKTDYFSPAVEKQAKEIIYGSQANMMNGNEEVPKEQYTTFPQQNDRFMKSAFASNFNDINYRKVYKDMPPIRG